MGTSLVSFILAQLETQKPKRVWLESQVQAKKFYEKCGFRAVSEPFILWGMPHVTMEYAKA
ncbi:MAG: GNAT family N-acetyltransferase [Candidatus Aenigmarchaeota archaeon]|nr:GNAT family N-acetyltransferase [Candidatus Aenigmarchaeota archaeon]